MRGIFSVVLGGIMVVGGLSGNLVMRGTDSGVALAVIGGLLMARGIYVLIRMKREE